MSLFLFKFPATITLFFSLFFFFFFLFEIFNHNALYRMTRDIIFVLSILATLFSRMTLLYHRFFIWIFIYCLSSLGTFYAPQKDNTLHVIHPLLLKFLTTQSITLCLFIKVLTLFSFLSEFLITLFVQLKDERLPYVII